MAVDGKQEDHRRLKFGPDIICHIVANQPDCFFDGEISSLLAFFQVPVCVSYGNRTYKSVFRIRDILKRIRGSVSLDNGFLDFYPDPDPALFCSDFQGTKHFFFFHVLFLLIAGPYFLKVLLH